MRPSLPSLGPRPKNGAGGLARREPYRALGPRRLFTIRRFRDSDSPARIGQRFNPESEKATLAGVAFRPATQL